MAVAKLSEEEVKLRELLQVQSPQDVVDWMNILMYGEAGAGKTYWSGMCEEDPRLRPMLIFDVDGGMVTLRNKPGIDVITVRSMDEVEKKYNQLFHSIKTDPKTGKPSIYYKTVSIDRLDELTDLDMRKVMKAAYARNPEKVDIDVPSPREWGIVRNHTRLIVRAFRDLPCHVIFIAGLGVIQKENEPDKYVPSFAGKLQREIPGFADIVGFYRARNRGGEIERTLQVMGTDRVVAKDRTGVLGATITNPTPTSIWNTIEGKELAPLADSEELATE